MKLETEMLSVSENSRDISEKSWNLHQATMFKTISCQLATKITK